jgi:ketosteroid isomerase-like protein
LRGVNALLAADREFSAAARADAMAAISDMLADDVAMPTGDHFTRGKAATVDALQRTLGFRPAHAEWTPIRGGISADGQHGFTLGYMMVQASGTASIPLKYLAYWTRSPAGWRVVAYNVRPRPGGAVSLAMMAPSLPAQWIPRTADTRGVRHRESLIDAERAFSDRAQRVGLGPAFAENGSADAVNMGGRDAATFTVGSAAIGRMIGAGSPQSTSPVFWSADRAIVASTGDLGVTFGVVRPNPSAGDTRRPRPFAFFTIWRRLRPSDPWRYIAE